LPDGGFGGGGYLIIEWEGLYETIRGTAPTIANAKMKVTELIEETANRKALRILDGMKVRWSECETRPGTYTRKP
jgi:hypothetical protein